MGKCRRKLKDGEYFNSSNNRYEYHYTDRLGKKRVITSARLEPNDPLPKSKRGVQLAGMLFQTGSGTVRL